MYRIMLGEEIVGEAHVARQGLYYLIQCDCALSGDVMYELWVVCDQERKNLGICVPKGDRFGLETRIPIKTVGSGTLSFTLMPKRPKIKEKFVPIIAEEPFQYLRYMENAYLSCQNGQLGAVFPAQSSDGSTFV